MLTNKERKRIKTYGVLLKLAIPSLLMSFVPGVIWIVLEMIDDIVLQSSGLYMIGLWAFLGFVMFYLLVFCYALLRVKFGISSRAWREIVSGKGNVKQNHDTHSGEVSAAVGAMAIGRLMKESSNDMVSNLGTASEVAGAVLTIDATNKQVASMKKNVQMVADYYCVTIPSIKKWILCFVLLPFILMPLLFLPRFQDANAKRKEEIKIVQTAQNEIAKSFEKYFTDVSVDNPERRSMDSYSVNGYLKNEDDVYISIELNKEGKIKEIAYHMDVLDEKSKEENIKKFNSYIEQEILLLKDVNVDFASHNLAEWNQIPEQAVQEYMDGSETKDLFVSEEMDGVKYTFSYNIENSSETSPAYFYYTVE